MSIPQARKIIAQVIDELPDLPEAKYRLERALELMYRKKPEFIAPATIPPLTEAQKAYARMARSQGTPVNEIARALNTNHGRVSEAINSA